MYSFKSRSVFIIYIPRRVKHRLYILFTIMFNRKESQRESIHYDLRYQNAIYAVAMNTVPNIFVLTKAFLDSIYSPTC
jgi:hypothetical protein